MKRIFAILAIVLLSSTAMAQTIDLQNKEWYSRGQIGAAPPTWSAGEYAHILAWQNPANNLCMAQSDANCNLFMAPGAGVIWEVRVRDGDGATLADVSQPSLLTTNWTEYFLNTLAALHGIAYDDNTLFVPGMVLAGAGQRDNVLNNSAGLITTSFTYGYDSANTTWDRVESTAYAASIAATQTGMLVYNGNYFYDLTNTNMHRWDGDVMSNETYANTNTSPMVQNFNFGYDATSGNWRWVNVVNTQADNQATTLNGLVTSSILYGYDGATFDMVRIGASGEVQMTDVATRPGEDAGNDWRKGKKEETAVYNPAVTTGTAVDDVGTDIVCASTYVLNLPNWSVFVKNAGGGSGDVFNNVDVQISYNGTDWSSETSTACDTLASGASARCYKGVTESAAYVRVIASCGAADDTTADCVIQGNKN